MKSLLRDNSGCFGGGAKAPSPSPVPPPAPPPPAPSEPMVTQGNTQQKLARLRYGLASTIKTSPRGITGSGADMMSSNNNLKKTLGS